MSIYIYIYIYIFFLKLFLNLGVLGSLGSSGENPRSLNAQEGKVCRVWRLGVFGCLVLRVLEFEVFRAFG